MKAIFIVLMTLVSAARADSPNQITLFQVGRKTIGLPLEMFRSRAEQARILTRRDQLLRRPVAGVGMSIRNTMTPVENQGARGTCNVFAAVGLLEAFTGEIYSEQCLARLSSDQDPGRVEERLEYVRRNGIYYDRDCPYDESQRDNIPAGIDKAPRKRFDQEFEVYPFKEDNPLDYIKSRLAVHSPVAIEFYVVGKKSWQQGPFVYQPDAKTIALECGFEQACAGHSVIATGMNDTLGLIEFKNSWSSEWGDRGYGYLSYDYFLTFGKGFLVSY